MLVPVFGTVGALAEFALHTVVAMANASGLPHEVINTHSGSEFSSAWEARQSDNVVLFSDSPDAALVQLMLESNIPFSVFLESGESAAASVWEIAGSDMWPARVRVLSRAVLHDLAVSPQAMIIRSDVRISRTRLLGRLADHYRLPTPAAHFAEIESQLGGAADAAGPLLSVPPLPVPPDKASFVDVRWRERLAPVFSGFDPLLDGRRVDVLRWPQEVFLTAMDDGAPGPLTGPIDLTGPARTVIWGPFLNLPRGRWSARAVIRCDQNPSGCRMGGDVYSDVVLATWSFRLPEEGTYAFEVEFVVHEPRVAIEMRFFLKEGVIDGVFELEGVDFRRLE